MFGEARTDDDQGRSALAETEFDPQSAIGRRLPLPEFPDAVTLEGVDVLLLRVLTARGELKEAQIERAEIYLRQSSEDREFLGDPEALERFWRRPVSTLPKEVFEVASLDAGYRLLRDGVLRVEDGIIVRAAVLQAEVAEATLGKNACAAVVAQNHTNGKLHPSEADTTLTRALVLALDAIHRRVLDHLTMPSDGVFSFRQQGLL